MLDADYADAIDSAIDRLRKHIHQELDGTFTLTDGESEGIDPIILADLTRSIEVTNQHVRDGQYQVGDAWTWDL